MIDSFKIFIDQSQYFQTFLGVKNIQYSQQANGGAWWWRSFKNEVLKSHNKIGGVWYASMLQFGDDIVVTVG